MFAAILLAASVATSFIDDFKGTWLCGDAKTKWTIAPYGDRWATVKWGDPANPGGVAYVGYLDADNVFAYNDFHGDGAMARLTSPAPTNHSYHWTGSYYAVGQAKDDSADIFWKLTPMGTIHRDFGQMVNGVRVPRGADECVKAP